MTVPANTALERFTAASPCSVCGGHPGLPQGRAIRCAGFRTEDGYVHCTREERAGPLKATGASPRTFAHFDRDNCLCGQPHARYGASTAKRRAASSRHDSSWTPAIEAIYDYTDAAGTLLYQTVRYQPKDFRQRRPDGRGGWIWNLDGVRRVPYRLPALLAADPDCTIFVVEGEKDADRLESLDLVATTNSGGARNWTDAHSEYLRGHKRAVVLADLDNAGRDHQQIAARSLCRVVNDVRVVNFSGLPEGGDVSDWLDAGRTVEELHELVNAAPAEGVQTDEQDGSEPERDQPKADALADWPAPPDAEAFGGLAGDFVATLRAHTEADDIALLVSFLEASACAIGPGPYVSVGEARHAVNLYSVTVGNTSRARKGHAWESTRRLFLEADPSVAKVMVTGLSTGEGLIERIHDDVEVREWNKRTKTFDIRMDPGQDEKRLLAIETEMARTLEVARRDGNTLSAVLRQAWDGGALHVVTRKSPLTATGGHVCVLGHITVEELRRCLDDVSVANGFANRFLWFLVRRARYLPRPEPVSDEDRARLVRRIRDVLVAARGRGRLSLDADAEIAWDAAYRALTADRPGLVGFMTARVEAHALRLALLYALLDGDDAIRARHIFAALAVVDYADRSVTHLFGDRLGDPVADTILDALRKSSSMTRAQVSGLFSHHVSASRLNTSIVELVASGAITIEEKTTAGRPVTVLTLGSTR